MGNFLEKWVSDNSREIDKDKAKDLYKEAMIYEFEVFNYFSKTYIWLLLVWT